MHLYYVSCVKKHPVLYYNVYLIWFINIPTLKTFYMIKHVYGTTKTVYYKVYLIWSMK